MFRVVVKEQAFSFDTKLLIDTILDILSDKFKTLPTDYFITGPYPDEGWKTKNGFLKAVERKQFKNICHLILSTGLYSFSFENWLLNDAKPKDRDYQAIEFSINEKICDPEKMEDIYRELAIVFEANYAIIFQLPTNYMPSTESKIKGGFFNYSVAKNPKENIWRQYIDKVDKALIKDIYPINFINDSVLNSDSFQRSIVSKNIGKLDRSGNGLYKWILSREEIVMAKEKLADTNLLPK